MYERYFGLTERPFSIAPDPHYLYMSLRHKEAMAHLSYGLSQGGCFIVLTGEVGTGKTTLCRNLLTDLPDNVDVALIINANVDEKELLQTVCDELKIDYESTFTQKQLLDSINNHLLETFADNRHTVLIIDEAQILKRDVLEQIRLLTNLETTKSKLLQIILIGQPELYGLLSRNDLRQLAQRVTARYHLGALQRNEIEEYVNYRLSVAGCKQPLFSRLALNKMHDLTGGIPRKINVLADHALLATYSQNKVVVDSRTVAKAVEDVFIKTKSDSGSTSKVLYRKWLPLFALVLLGINIAAWFYFVGLNQAPEGSLSNDFDRGASAKVLNAASDEFDSVLSVVNAESDAELVPVELVIDTSKSDEFIPGTAVISETYLTADSVVGEQDVLTTPIVVGGSALQTNFDEDTPLGSILDVSADLTGRITAFRRLAVEWGRSLPEQILQPVCQASAAQGLYCLSINQWLSLKAFNRPAILVLSHLGRSHRVIVKSVDGDTANVLIGDLVQPVKLAELRQRWTGAGVILWRASSSEPALLTRGDSNEDVLRVREMLNGALSVSGLAALESTTSRLFDDNMMQKTQSLQQKFGLNGDGQIGNETYLLINELVNEGGTPVLVRRLAPVNN